MRPQRRRDAETDAENAENAELQKMKLKICFLCVCLCVSASLRSPSPSFANDKSFTGEHFSGEGDVPYLEMLETSRRMFQPDPRWQNLSMLYEPKWNGFVEGPTWNAWWIQNSYGTTYAWLPFASDASATFIANS